MSEVGAGVAGGEDGGDVEGGVGWLVEGYDWGC